MDKLITIVGTISIAAVLLFMFWLAYLEVTEPIDSDLSVDFSKRVNPTQKSFEGSFTFAKDVSDSQSAKIDVGGVTKYAEVNGKVKSANLFLRGFVEDNPLFTEWEDFYFSLGNGREQAGGHLVNSETALFEEIDVDLSQAYLYKLGRQDFQVFDFLPIINSGRRLRFDLFISSARSNRFIKEATLFYVCESECSVSLAQ